MHRLFTDPLPKGAAPCAVRDALGKAECPGLRRLPAAPEATSNLRALLAEQIAETEELQGLLSSLNLPILHLSADLRLRRFSRAAAPLFGLSCADLGGRLNQFWPRAPSRDLAEVCRTGVSCGPVAQGPDGKDWQCQILPRKPRHGLRASVIVILLAAPDPMSAKAATGPDSRDLTPRQRQVMELVLAGHPSKIIAAHLKISQRTVENHRAAIMQRTGATSLPALARIAVGAAGQADHRLRPSLHDLRA